MSKRSRGARGSRARFKILAMVLVGAGLLVLGVAAWVILPRPQSTAASEAYDSVVPIAVSFPAPALELSDLQGGKVSLKDYRGQVVLVNNWATWCPPCRAEMPTLEAYFKDHRDQGFALIGIEAGDPQPDVAQFVERYGLSFPIWLDPQNESLKGFYNSGLPNSYVIDRDGRVVMSWTGAISREMLEKHLTPLLKE
jgi:cytochrome c biogenesis protein CcmG/thiol:disulfide interchange protein DsbE